MAELSGDGNRDPASGRVVAVTGGAGGIGRAIAAAFAREGDRIVIVDVDPGRLAAAAGELSCAHVVVDVADFDAVHETFAAIEREHGPVEVLVNCAGVMSRTAVKDTDFAEWRRVVGINLDGTFAACHAVVPSMESRGSGWIVNVGSIWAQHVWPNRAAYSASKAAVEQFTRCLALELAPAGIRVNAISPGLMRSAMTESVVDDPVFNATFMPRVGVGRVGEPESDLASLVLFLTSPAASYLCGEVVAAHGAYY